MRVKKYIPILGLVTTLNFLFASDNISNIDGEITLSKKLLNKKCNSLDKKLWLEGNVTYPNTTILNIYRENILSFYFDPKPNIKEIQYFVDYDGKTCPTKGNCYDIEFKWLNDKNLLVQMHYPANKGSDEDCESWLYEQNKENVDVYHFISWGLPD